MAVRSDDLDQDDAALVRPPIFAEVSHGGRVARLLIALALTAVGWMLVGYPHSGILFAPAAVLLLFAMRGKRRRLLLVAFGAPTALGLALSGFSCVLTTQRFGIGSIDDVIVWTFAATLVAVLFGSPRVARRRDWF